MTFFEFCRANNVTPKEREELAWHFAAMKMRQAYEACTPTRRYYPRLKKERE